MDKEFMGSGRAPQEVGETYVVDIDLPFVQIRESKTKKLIGECIRCGKCCQRLNLTFQVGRDRQEYTQDCKWLGWVTAHGEKKAMCKIYHKRPVGCAAWPRPSNAREDGCGFKWVDK
jgi:Fe-S-cluster containining protein